ncbi:MAG: hypothetical protein ACLTS6_07000 [Anaerobutyricum sp.]
MRKSVKADTSLFILVTAISFTKYADGDQSGCRVPEYSKELTISTR